LSRTIRLTLGVLLVAIAVVLFLEREEAVNKNIVDILVAVFAAPGLLLLALGILPRRGMPVQIRMDFKPATLAIGLAVSFAGAAVVALHGVIPLMPHALMVGALLAVPGGLIYAATCWSESCAKCLAPLEDKRIGFAAERKAVENVVKSGSAMRILELEPRVANAHPVHVKLRYCPKCRQLAVLSGPGSATAVLVGDPAIRLVKHVG